MQMRSHIFCFPRFSGGKDMSLIFNILRQKIFLAARQKNSKASNLNSDASNLNFMARSFCEMPTIFLPCTACFFDSWENTSNLRENTSV